MYMLEGVSSVANFITAYVESQLNRDSHFLIRSVFFVSKGNLLTFIIIGTTLFAIHDSKPNATIHSYSMMQHMKLDQD